MSSQGVHMEAMEIYERSGRPGNQYQQDERPGTPCTRSGKKPDHSSMSFDNFGQKVCKDDLKCQAVYKTGRIYIQSESIYELRSRGEYMNDQRFHKYELKILGLLTDKSNPGSLYKRPEDQHV